MEDDLTGLVSVPSIAFPGYPVGPVREAADLTEALLRKTGLPEVRQIPVEGSNALVYGSSPAPPGAPTVLLYAHYDVQTAGEESLWRTDPFQPVVADGKMYGRGTADNKSGIVAHCASLAAFEGHPPVGVKVVIEGEEEYGGPALDAFVRANPQLFTADIMLIADAGGLRVGEPAIVTSLRGAAGFTIWASALRAPLHSGEFGGAAPDAVTALVRMLATLHDEAGEVAVAGLPRDRWTGAPLQQSELDGAMGLLAGVEPVGTGPLADRLWSGSAIIITGMDVPSLSAGVNAIQPMARARLTVRVPPLADPGKAMDAVVDHLERVAPWGVQVVASHEVLGKGFRAGPGGRGHLAMAAAMSRTFGRPVREIGSGASIPIVATLAEVFPDAEILIYGAEDRAAGIHAPNERLDLAELDRLIKAETLLLRELA